MCIHMEYCLVFTDNYLGGLEAALMGSCPNGKLPGDGRGEFGCLLSLGGKSWILENFGAAALCLGLVEVLDLQAQLWEQK